MRQIARYGWTPDLPDHRDFLVAPTKKFVMPKSVDLRPHLPAVYDQGQLGSCTANAIGAAFEYEAIRLGKPAWTPSRLFIYYNERSTEGTVAYDSGAQIRDGVKSVAKLGVVPETEWAYDISQFAVQPPSNLYSEALQNRSTKYSRCAPVHVRWALGHGGFPVVFGFTVYESFESEEVATSGVVSLPEPGETVLGGHAVLAVGYDDARQQVLVRNSWGPDWGLGGYFWMPYAYILDANLASDFWCIQTVTESA